jgi:hypothetical protein
MVDPVSDEERERFALKLKAGFVLLVGLSAGLITLQGEVGPLGFLGATVGGVLAGAVLVRVVFPAREELERGSRRGRR